METVPRLNLAFGSASGIGGSERRMLEVVSELAARSVVVRVFGPGRGRLPLNTAMARAGASVITYRHPGALARQASKSTADATWAFGARAALPLLVRKALPGWTGGQLWVAQNGLEAMRSGPALKLQSILIRQADLVIANSASAAERAAHSINAPTDRIRILPSALGPEWTGAIPRKAHDLVRIAMIGNARPEKQHAIGLRAFEMLGDAGTTLDLFTNDATEARTVVKSLPVGVKSRIEVHEGEAVTPEVMRAFDILLHPSSSESLPRVALEARSQSLWVVGFDVGDLGPYCNAIIPWGDGPALVDALRDACRDVRAGVIPAGIEVNSVSGYVDSLLCLLSPAAAAEGRPQW